MTLTNAPSEAQIRHHLLEVREELFKQDKILLAHNIKDHLQLLCDLCRLEEWHETGLYLFVAAEKLEEMIESNQQVQSIESYKKHVNITGGKNAAAS